MTESIKSVLYQATKRLANGSSARLDAELLLSYVLNRSRASLYAHSEQQLTPQQHQAYQRLIIQREHGVPIAYLTQQREFWSLPLIVREGTLIPRPETELLVERTLSLLTAIQNARLLDLGSGTGAIALALASERPDWQITACDKSETAIEVIRDNRTKLNIENVTVLQTDWFSEVPKHLRFHAILSNPPYIDEQDSHLSQGDLRFEPRSALVSGNNGLRDLFHIIEHSSHYLVPGGLLLLEHGFNQANQVTQHLAQNDFQNINTWEDLNGIPRVSGGYSRLRSRS